MPRKHMRKNEQKRAASSSRIDFSFSLILPKGGKGGETTWAFSCGVTDKRDGSFCHCPSQQPSLPPAPPGLTPCPFASAHTLTSPIMNQEDCGLWQIINQSRESRGQIPGLFIFNIRRASSGEYFMKGPLRFNPLLVIYPSHIGELPSSTIPGFQPSLPLVLPPVTITGPLGLTS